MAKSNKQAAGNKQESTSKRSNDAGKPGNPASNTAATGNAQLMKSQPDTAMADAIAGLPQLPAADPAGQSVAADVIATIVAAS